ncbi:MAG: cysteine--tRNA ligase [Elusimicrobia bacterium]|nr:cysteine--tRNA ligase [Elusimicrobiota bacterium]
MNSPELRFHNTMSGEEEVFTPLEEGRVKMYVCGITPYDECHVGHARCYVTFDFIRRALKRLGYHVTCVQNFTDIDDKIIQRAAQKGESPAALADRYIADYFDKMDQLNVLRADAYPRVTAHVPAVIAFIERLVAKKLAYAAGGDVFFSVRKFPHYGKLSKRDLDDLRAGARVEVDARKQDPLDFALWKAAKPGEPSWPSPWGAGRPGWHIECSVMSLAGLGGDTFDIHGGGQDLIFPHHENEIAQSEGATGKPFARYWIHNGFVTVDKEKMSKSLGNFFTLGDIFKKHDPRTVRFFLLSHHYKGPLEFNEDQLLQAQAQLGEIEEDIQRLESTLLNPLGVRAKEEKSLKRVLEGFDGSVDAALAENFNSPRVIAAVFALLGELKARVAKGKPVWAGGLEKGLDLVRTTLREVLGLPVLVDSPKDVSRATAEEEAIRFLVEQRQQARQAKNWGESDRLREELASRGVIVEDTPQGPRWWKKK